jgi:CubicO group peptidase (beta-lactamase class C family)
MLMRRAVVLLVMLVWMAPAAAANTVADPRAQAIAEVLTRYGFEGEVLVADRERIRFEQQRGGGAPGQRWRWASVSKQVAAALAMRQVQAGRIALDEPIAGHLRALPAAAAHPRVTLRHLLMHTSGLPNPEVGTLAADPLPQCLGPATMAPGERFEYRNCDTLVLAALLQRLTGKPYAELLRSELDSAIGAHRIELATTPPEVAAYGAAAALTGTARELLALDRALLAQRWLSADLTRQMHTGEPRLGYVALGAWGFEAPLKGCPAALLLVERRGAIPGVQVRNILVPALGVAVIVFTPLERFEFGEVWQGRGFTHDVLAAALCP